MNKPFLSVEVAKQNTLKRLQTLEDLTSKTTSNNNNFLQPWRKLCAYSNSQQLHQYSNNQQFRQYSNDQQLRQYSNNQQLRQYSNSQHVEVVVSVSDGVDVARIGGPTAIICTSDFSTALARRFLGCGSGDWSGKYNFEG